MIHLQITTLPIFGNMHFSLSDCIQLSAFLVSLSVFVRKPVPLYLKLFPCYLILLLVENIVLEYTTPRGIHNTFISNICGIAEFLFYLYVIRSVIANTMFKKVIFYTTSAFVFFALINLFFIQKNDRFNPINFTLGTVLSVVFCLYYYLELFKKTENRTLSKLIGFWLVSGIFFNVVISFPMYVSISFMDNMSKTNQKTMTIFFDHIEAVYDILNVLTYTLYSIGFISRIRIGKSIG